MRAAAGLDNVDNSVFDLDNEPAMELGKQQSQEKHSLHNRDRGLVATIFLCMMCYARNQQSNLLQIIIDYLAYADNIPKQTAEILHQMGLLMTSETI